MAILGDLAIGALVDALFGAARARATSLARGALGAGTGAIAGVSVLGTVGATGSAGLRVGTGWAVVAVAAVQVLASLASSRTLGSAGHGIGVARAASAAGGTAGGICVARALSAGTRIRVAVGSTRARRAVAAVGIFARGAADGTAFSSTLWQVSVELGK